MRYITYILLVLTALSCEKPEGPGGNSSIKGRIMLRSYDKGFRVLQSEYPAADEDVYITYGNNDKVSDNTVTSPGGYFEFPYLGKGEYRIFLYSDDTLNSLPGKISIEKTISLESNNTQYNAGDIYIYDMLAPDKGRASVEGTVHQANYVLDFLYIRDTTFAQEEPVYLVYENDPHYFERVRTLDDGTFAVPNLLIGNFKLIVYADDITGGTQKIARTRSFEIRGMDEKVDLGDIYIEKEDD